MPKVSRKAKPVKAVAAPKKRRTVRSELLPYPEFPLFPHHNGRWAKKIRGKLYYFGPHADWQAALEKYQREVDDLKAGKTPRESSDGMILGGPGGLAHKFIEAKLDLVNSGELSPRSVADYQATFERIIKTLGRNRLLTDLGSEDFIKLRRELAKTRGPVALGNEITRCRVLFKFAYDEGYIKAPIQFGSTFKRPKKKRLREHRQQQRLKNGSRTLRADELRALISKANTQFRAMILLGLNCGFGNTDIGRLTIERGVLKLDAGWIEFPRPKTSIPRYCPLWPETVDALRKWLEKRPMPKDEADDDLVFVTKRRTSWSKDRDYTIANVNGTAKIRASRDNPVAKEMAKLLTSLGIKRRGLSFYALRHTFATVGGNGGDQMAVEVIMGHSDDKIIEQYQDRSEFEKSRLKAVTDHVRNWLLTADRGDEKEPEGGWTIETKAEPAAVAG